MRTNNMRALFFVKTGPVNEVLHLSYAFCHIGLHFFLSSVSALLVDISVRHI